MQVKIYSSRVVAMLILAVINASAAASSMPPSVYLSDAELLPSSLPQEVSIDLFFESEEGVETEVAGFQLSLSIEGPDDRAQFMNAHLPRADYLFPTSASGPLWSISEGGQRITIGDFVDVGTGKIRNGIGLATLRLQITNPTAGSVYKLLVESGPEKSFLATSSTDFLPFEIRTGTVAVVPEPHSLALVAICGCLIRRPRRVA